MRKPVYTVRCTTLEGFREWINSSENDDKPWVCEENVIGNIKGIESVNVKADYGTAGHAIIEDPKKYKVEFEPQTFTTVVSERYIMPHDPIYGYQVKDFVFTDTQAAPMLKHRSEHPLWVREVALSKLYSTPNFDLIITGTTDAVEGLQLRDTKFKFSNFNVSDFIESAQWRIYLDMIGLDIFWYDFFKVTGFSDMRDMGKSVIHDCDSMMVKRYPSMEADIQAIVNEFAEFVEFKKLTQHLNITEAKRKRIANGDPKLLKLI